MMYFFNIKFKVYIFFSLNVSKFGKQKRKHALIFNAFYYDYDEWMNDDVLIYLYIIYY
jgi:hypothetical protein